MSLLCSFISVIIFYAVVTSSLTCLSCDSTPKPSACRYIDHCGPHEVCSIESYVTSIGSIIYSLGCKDSAFCGRIKRSNDGSNTQICADCCVGDLCNAAGCGQAGYSADLGPLCYSCTSQIGANMCNQIEQCGRDQICEIHPAPQPGSNEDWYMSQCKHADVCRSEQNANGAHGSQCNACCNMTICNDYVPSHCGFTTPLAPTSPQFTLTPTPTTAAAPVKPTGANHPLLVQMGNTDRCTAIVLEEAHKHGGILVQSGQYCFHLNRAQISWEHAERTCVTYGGHLFHIPGASGQQAVQAFLWQHYRHPVWMGLHDRVKEEMFQWTSGDPVIYTNWIPNRNSDFTPHSSEDCVVFIPSLNGGWDDIACGIDNRTLEQVGQHQAFMCQFPTKDASVTHHLLTSVVAPVNHVTSVTHPSTTTLYGNILMCPLVVQNDAHANRAVLAQHGDSCYEVITHGNSWQHAENHCIGRHGHLLHISNAEENAYIYNLLHGIFRAPVWMGLTDQHHEENFSWSSGAKLSYLNWTPDRKNSTTHDLEDCAIFLPNIHHHGQWDDVSCAGPVSPPDPHIQYYGYICQYPTDSMSPSQSTATTSQPSKLTRYGNVHSCPARVLHHVSSTPGVVYAAGTNCYVLEYSNTSWYNAEHLCQNIYHGHLADIIDVTEQNYLQRFLKHFIPNVPVWIGLNDIGSRGNFSWTSGADVNYHHWKSNTDPIAHFNNHGSCAYIMPFRNGEWLTTPSCSRSVHHPFLCKIKGAGTPLIG